MEDSSEDSLYTNPKFSLCFLGGGCHPSSLLVQNLFISKRTKPNNRKPSTVDPHLHRLPSLLQNLHDNPQENHHLREPQDRIRIRSLPYLKSLPCHIHHQLLLHLHLRLLFRLPCIQLCLWNQNYPYSSEVISVICRIQNCDYFVSSQLLSLVGVDAVMAVVGALLPFFNFYILPDLLEKLFGKKKKKDAKFNYNFF